MTEIVNPTQQSDDPCPPGKCQKRGCESAPTWGMYVMFYALPPHHPHPLMIAIDAEVCDLHRDETSKNPNLVASKGLILEAARIMKMNGAMIDPTKTVIAYESVGIARERREQLAMLKATQLTEVVDVKAEETEGKQEEGKNEESIQ